MKTDLEGLGAADTLAAAWRSDGFTQLLGQARQHRFHARRAPSRCQRKRHVPNCHKPRAPLVGSPEVHTALNQPSIPERELTLVHF